MEVVKVRAVNVPAGNGPEFERRFVLSRSTMNNIPGFLGLQLLRPTAGEHRYFVYTHWASEDAYRGWMNSEAWKEVAALAHAGGNDAPVSAGGNLLEFEVAMDHGGNVQSGSYSTTSNPHSNIPAVDWVVDGCDG